jgi:xylulokinase
MTGTLLGLDIGSSSIKGVILDLSTGRCIAHASSPATELEISSPQVGWAEQHPDVWWEHVRNVVGALRARHPDSLQALKAIGIAYQMHGLVLVDDQARPLRPAIIWCDSRAVPHGERARDKLGSEACLQRFGNAPGNFTASKLAWIKENEPETMRRVAYFMLPGDYIALKLTGKVGTTRSGLSEGVLWDFSRQEIATDVLSAFEIPQTLVPPIGDNVGGFEGVLPDVARELGLPSGVPITYRSGDQPNNALALNVLQPGEVAANAGTSGVVYGVTESLGVDALSRVNNFLHVNSTANTQRVGSLMCVNGTGSFYRWVRETFATTLSYDDLNRLAESSPIGAQGLVGIPYGNGAERTLANRCVGASFDRIDLNRHSLKDVIRATQEGIVFALCYGVEIMRSMGLIATCVRAGKANMFQSSLFCQTFSTALNVPLELYSTDGAEGAARGAGIGAGLLTYANAFTGLHREFTVEPDPKSYDATCEAYQKWKRVLERKLETVI